ncbi:LysR family transcriptional regulator [Pontitalea aquivivens]|uniref:LysR family transcriptional regulator n=1 Tax=Pontitalea aquivivens TaxID=3388663 RepID=UPI0039709540
METNILRAYALIVEEGTFSAAALRLGISKSMCSKHISDLEQTLGARLLTRSTRSVKPTAIGVEYYAKVRRILDLLDEVNECVKLESATATGKLRIGSPVSYSLRLMQAHILQFLQDYPGIQLESVFDDRKSDLIAEGFDAVIRIGDLEDTSMVARRLDSVKTLVVATPDYLHQHGTPERPGDLASHKVIHYTNMQGAETWPFQKDDELIWQKVHPRFSSNNGEIIRLAALAGHGIAYLPEFLIAEDLQAGTLVPIMTEFRRPDLPVSIIYPSRKNPSAALKAFLDFASRMPLC